MAKRKRLTPARPDYLDETAPAPETKSMFPLGVARHSPPIAQVAGSAATQAALEEVTEELRSARATGRLVQAVPLEAVDETHLVRDRISADDAEMEALSESLRARGQQVPIEVVELNEGRFGLISGWRRLTALKALYRDTGEERFATVLALLRQPESASDAYLAMVEENEIRVGLSYYERARIAARAAEQGVYPDETAALRGLFASASRAKRSKIGSFMALYHALDAELRFASAIPERLGLSLVKALREDPTARERISGALQASPAGTPVEEAEMLTRAMTPPDKKTPKPAKTESESFGDITLHRGKGGTRLVLSGAGVSEEFLGKLRTWLKTQA